MANGKLILVFRGYQEIYEKGAIMYTLTSDDEGQSWSGNQPVKIGSDTLRSYKGAGAIWKNDRVYFAFWVSYFPSGYPGLTLFKWSLEDNTIQKMSGIASSVTGGEGDDVALSNYSNKIVAGYVQGSNVVVKVSSDNGGAFGEETKVGQKTDRGVALCEYDGKLFLAYVGINSDEICWVKSDEPYARTWSGHKSTGQKTSSPCSMCVFKDELYLAYRGQSSNKIQILKYVKEDDSWKFKKIASLGDQTNAGVALASNDNYLFLAFDGVNSSDLQIRRSSNGTDWESKVGTGQKAGARSGFAYTS